MCRTADPLRESRIEQKHEHSPATQRMRLYRKQRRQGLRYVRILLDETDIDALIRDVHGIPLVFTSRQANSACRHWFRVIYFE